MTHPIVVAVWGPEKVGKSYHGLTYPKPMVVYDFDLGTTWALKHFQDDVEAGLIEVRDYTLPLQFNTPIVSGMKELWHRFLKEYAEDLKRPEIKTVFVDTGTQLWMVIRQAFLQVKQEEAEAKDKKRVRLLQIEYGQPNSRLESVIYSARSAGKNLVLTHYQRSKYVERLTERGKESINTGEYELDGCRYTAGLADVVMEMSETQRDKRTVFQGEIHKSRLAAQMTGLVFDFPTYETIMQAGDRLRMVPLYEDEG